MPWDELRPRDVGAFEQDPDGSWRQTMEDHDELCDGPGTGGPCREMTLGASGAVALVGADTSKKVWATRPRPEPGHGEGLRRGRTDVAEPAAQPSERSGGEPPLRVAFADDSYLLREVVGRLLETEPRVELVAVCSDGDELMAAVEEHRPQVVVVDIRMPPSGEDEGIRIANRLRDAHPDVGVVVLSQYVDPRYGLALLERGSDGRAYLLKERLRDREQLMAAVDAVAHAGSVIDAKVVEALIAERVKPAQSPLAELTQRELQILSHIAQGKTNQAIADTLFLTKRAVEKHINTIFLKLGLTNPHEVSPRVKAALIYLAEQPQ